MLPHVGRIHWICRVLLVRPGRVLANLEVVTSSGHVRHVPNAWQLTLGVVRMWHRMVFRSETVGLCVSHPPRSNWRARVFQYRPIRFPFLVFERAIAPLDLTGLLSSPARVTRHLLGTHHDGKQAAYDLELLACYPGALERLRHEVNALIGRDDARTRWLRDLVVYETYHERLHEAVEAALRGDLGLTPEEATNPDLSFVGFLAWCAAQPGTARETLAAWRADRYRAATGRTPS
ncbi:MAG: hypothetical protein IPK07_31700 [Deltaproteobacteria bacterium]|jgi:hypothetical protein|nr:hypothetical protein [Deltaproteobacteria bacterium]